MRFLQKIKFKYLWPTYIFGGGAILSSFGAFDFFGGLYVIFISVILPVHRLLSRGHHRDWPSWTDFRIDAITFALIIFAINYLIVRKKLKSPKKQAHNPLDPLR